MVNWTRFILAIGLTWKFRLRMNGVGPAVLLTKSMCVSSAWVALDGCKLRTRVVTATTMARTRAALWRLWFIFWLDKFIEFKPLSGFPRPESSSKPRVRTGFPAVAAATSLDFAAETAASTGVARHQRHVRRCLSGLRRLLRGSRPPVFVEKHFVTRTSLRGESYMDDLVPKDTRRRDRAAKPNPSDHDWPVLWQSLFGD